jgi:single-strand DNA-binding protein
MKDFNHFAFSGRIAAEPEMSYTSGGLAITRVLFAVSNDKFDEAKKEWIENTSWIRVTFFGKLAERIAQKSGKGDRCIAECNVSSYYEERDGNKYSGFNFAGNSLVTIAKAGGSQKASGGYDPSMEQAQIPEVPADEEDAPWDK